ncbi:MAG: bifunctional folylpolyglutamate synthase/dihydrofolate synthase [Candidatus Eremiobacteraeota bacterium]|nr:bifunctional folylpolyglutamate synthase/dihydrofolate synthase [Candidatus Eremiobacteraeota bacterium]
MKRIATYADAEAYLISTIGEVVSRRTSYKLDRITALLRELGNPHRAYPTIHVGGTSGKGSTVTMLASALAAAGRLTGMHTKPHLHAMTERAAINGTPIDPRRFAELLAEMMPALEATVARYGRPTYYETLLALAFTHFARERVEVAVIEVGLGGRLDGTNVIVPLVAAITSIGRDHTEVLGETLEAIASEKAGIAKRGVPLVVAAVPPAARAVIERHAGDAGAPVVNVDDVVKVVSDGSAAPGTQRVVATTKRGTYDFDFPLLGVFQRRNAATAIAVLEQLPRTLRPEPRDVIEAFARLRVPGRMELIAGRPPLIFDIAHNADKAEALVASLHEAFPGRRAHYVVAIGETKDARRIIEALARLPCTFTFTSFATQGRTAIAPQRLATIAESIGSWGRAIGDPTEALQVARRMAAIDDVIVVTGSTFVVAELRQWYLPSAVA